MGESESGYVIYDCDIGTDDAWGLLMLIRGEEEFYKKSNNAGTNENGSPRKYKILGVTCVYGNTDLENAAKNTLRVLDSVDRKDIPVFKGCAQSILPRTWERKRFFHGHDGFGDVTHEKDITTEQLRTEHAVNAMYEFACKYPNQVDYILVGPMTNFAVCISMYGSDFLDKVRNVYMMGGNFRGKGNITKSAEFNFMMDPEAAHVVFENVKKPLLLLPWETCIDGDFGITLDWRLQVLANGRNKALPMMNYVERAVFIPKGFVNWIAPDAIMVAAYIFPHLAISKSRMYHATVELTGSHTRGQVVLDHLRHKETNAKVITEIHRKYYRNIISWTADLESADLLDH